MHSLSAMRVYIHVYKSEEVGTGHVSFLRTIEFVLVFSTLIVEQSVAVFHYFKLERDYLAG